MNAFQILQGVETLPLRMQRHVENARKLVDFLVAHEAVESVAYPGLESHPDHALAQKLLPRGCGSVFSFSGTGGLPAGKKFIETLKLLSHLANVGDARTLIIHPASTTHRQLSDEQQRAAGVTPDMIRLSVGLESIDDLLWDIGQALEKSQQA
jgi:O-acetylhomoserine (thiol)-lyase